MKILKFRYWDEIKQKMVYADSTYKFAEFFKNTSGKEVMQFTGLQDKNSKDIFCGDILKVTSQSVKDEAHYFQGDHWMDDGSDPFVEDVHYCRVFWDKSGKWAIEYYDWFLSCAGDSQNGEPLSGTYISPSFSEVLGHKYEFKNIFK